MKTLLLRIDGLDPTLGGYLVSLLTWSPPAGPVQDLAITGVIPGNLKVQGSAERFDARQMRECFADAAGPDPVLQQIGTQLYALLAQGAVAQVIQVPDQRVLLDIRATDLQHLPWELLWRQQDKFPQFGDLQQPFCRGTLEEGQPLPDPDWPLRLMVAIGARANDLAVQSEQELEQILTALTPCDPDIDLLVWRRQGKANLVSEIQRFKPHILHFIGHGQVTPDGNASLEVCVEGGPNELWEPNAIRTDNLADALRLVLINACRSSDASASQAVNRNGIWSVTDAFLAAGVPAVLGMRSDVAAEDAAHFAARFYKALADGAALDVAVAVGRQAIYQRRSDGLQRREWASPCLQVRRPPEQILRIGAGIAQNDRKAVLDARDFHKNRQWVDRQLERRRAWQGIASEQRSLLVIEGEEGVGKTRFAYLLMERCSLCGHDVRYVDLEEYIQVDSRTRQGDFLTLLRAIRDGNALSKHILRQPLPADKFGPFNRKVNVILGVAPPAGQGDVDQWAFLTPLVPDDARRDLLFAFRDCLEKSVVRPPLMIVLDHLQSLAKADFKGYLIPYLLDWCVGRTDIRIVLLLTPSQYRDFELQDLESDFHHAEVSAFSLKDWEELAMGYLRRTRPNKPLEFFEMWRAVLPMLRQAWEVPDPWKPGILEKL